MREVRSRTARWMAVGAAVLASGLASGRAWAEAPAARGTPHAGDAATLTSAKSQDEFPTIGRDADGAVWVAWVSFDGKRDAVLAKRLGDPQESAPSALSREVGDYWRPVMGTDGDGRMWVTWSQNDKGNWDLWGKFLSAGQWSGAVRLTRNTANDFAQQLAADSSGRLWMVWQAVVDRNYEVMLARVTQDGLQETRNVSRHPANDWEPAIATASDGRIFVGWDRYRNGSYDVLVSTLRDGKLSDPIAVAATPAYEAHAALAADRQGRLWVAWDNGGRRWAYHSKPRVRLHDRRSVDIRCLVGDRVFTPREGLGAILSGKLARFCELPELIVDGTGRLWLIVRHLTDLTPKGRRKGNRPHQARGIWNPYAICYAGGRWSEPIQLPVSNGRNDMRVAMCLDRAGQVRLAWAEDGRRPERSYEPVNHNVRAAVLIPPTEGKVELAVKPLDQPASAVGKTDQAVRTTVRHAITAGGKTYTLFYGDTHRHTDISRCAMNYDGSLLDTYRYAIDVAALDFLAISDHDQDLLKHRHHRKWGPLQDYAWWRSQKYCDLFMIEGKFIPIYGYEHGGTMDRRGGHQNILYAQRGMPCYEQDAPEELFKLLKGKDAVVIPHQLADGKAATDWARVNVAFEPVAEIYQARGSYEYSGALPKPRVNLEGNYIQDALAKGIRIGVIASSDHGLVSGAYAGVYASELSRKGVLSGLRARRTFGATDRILIEFRMQDRLMGEEIEVQAPPRFVILVRGTASLKHVEVVRDGRSAFSKRADGAECQFAYVDPKLAAGQSAYYYIRCEQENGDRGWSSAIWVSRK